MAKDPTSVVTATAKPAQSDVVMPVIITDYKAV
jgi:hypothetical protein